MVVNVASGRVSCNHGFVVEIAQPIVDAVPDKLVGRVWGVKLWGQIFYMLLAC